jgi:hypothetical protein
MGASDESERRRNCAFEGAEVPFVMRLHDGQGYQLIGECYIHGFMYGEGTRDGFDKVEFVIC